MTPYRLLGGASALLLGASWVLAACSSAVRIGQDFAGGGTIAGTSGVVGTSGSGGTTTSPVCQVTACQAKIYACGDCLDNDGDGLIDSADPECTGPCDNTEDSYFGGIPGQNNAPCREDCYFDQDTGSGNDRCFWNQACDPLAAAPGYPPSGDARCAYDPSTKTPGTSASCEELMTTQDTACGSYCLPLTPNGCDCFGCCELPAESGKFVWLGSTLDGAGSCTPDALGDASKCHPCTPVPSCMNGCDPCEVCVGRTAPSTACAGSTSSRCPVGVAACGRSGDPVCPSDSYCVTGCCIAAPI